MSHSLRLGGDTHCGAVLTGQSDNIISPDKSGSGTYDNFVACLWTIQLQDDFVIVFVISEIDIQMDSSTCKTDYLEVPKCLCFHLKTPISACKCVR